MTSFKRCCCKLLAADEVLRPKLRSPPRLLQTRLLISGTAPHLLDSLLKQCSNLKSIQQMHGFMVSRGLDHDNLFLSQFIDACSTLGFFKYAYLVFTHKPHPNTYLYNTMIRALCQANSNVEAVLLYNKIRAVGLRPDTYSFPFVLKAVARLSVIELGREIHCQTVPTGLDSDVHVITALVQMYSYCGCLSDAHKLFDEVSIRDVALWNAMIAGYSKAGEVDKAQHLLHLMPHCQRNVISWTCVIAGYAQMDRPDEAIAAFRCMQVENVEPDEIAILAALSACARLGALELGEWIYNYVNKHGLNKTVPFNNALIDMYAKSGEIGKALQVFENMRMRTVITWTTIIAGLALHGLGREALAMFTRMQREGIKPNGVTFIAILSACAHAGLVELCAWYFSTMRLMYGIKPKIEHYCCMVDALGRAGFLLEAQELVRRMPFEANAAIWGSILAASNLHGELELGEHALQHLIKFEPQNGGSYSLLSNIYTSLGKWNESSMVRKLMRDTGYPKIPGGSFIEMNNRVHEFIAGDTSHPQFSRINYILQEMDEQLKSTPQKEYGESLELDEG